MTDSLGERMKQYEDCYDVRISRRLPLIVRIDGKAFHSWTSRTKCAKPFDHQLMELMAETTKYLCEQCGGCVFGYTQSDEISLLLRDDQSKESTAWFDKRLQKIASLSAAIATYYFNANNPFEKKHPAFFDSRVFILPNDEIRNYFIWRQNDATKNSLSMLARSLYAQKELHGKRRDELQELCWQKGCNWNNLTVPERRGYAVYRNAVTVDGKFGPVERMRFCIDRNIPVFSANDCFLFESVTENP